MPFVDCTIILREKRRRKQRRIRNVKAGQRKAARKMFLGPACEWCGTSDALTVDHIIPLSEGGKTKKENCRTLCRPCHDRAETLKQHPPDGE